MANADHILDAVRSVSLHLEALSLLGDVLSSVIDDAGTRRHQYDFCVVFSLLAQAAQQKCGLVEEGIQVMLPLKRDMDALAREVSCA